MGKMYQQDNLSDRLLIENMGKFEIKKNSWFQIDTFKNFFWVTF